jgi:hypothetical protein
LSPIEPIDGAAAGGPAAPVAVRRMLLVWHRAECWLAVVCFGLIAALLLTDVLGRELVGPVLRAIGIDLGPMGLFGSQRVSVYALIVGSFAGIGIATATGSHLVPRVGYVWVPNSWDPAMNRLADLLTGLAGNRLACPGARLGGLADADGDPSGLPVGRGALLSVRRMAGKQATAARASGISCAPR